MDIKRLEHLAESEKDFPLYRYWQIWSEYFKKEINFTEYLTPKLEEYKIRTHVRKPYEALNY